MTLITSYIKRNPLFTLLLVLFIGLLCSQIFLAFVYTKYYDVLAVDGAFQLLNPLRRLADGQIPGRDFQVFHGIGIVYLHFIPFVLLGGNLFANEMVRWSLTGISFNLLNYFFFRSFGLKKEFALAASIVFFVLLTPLFLFRYLPEPGNSLLGIRSAMPLLSVILLLVLSKKFLKEDKLYRLEVLAGLFAALSVFFGTEHGIAFFAGTALMLLLFPFKERVLRERIVSLLVFVPAFVFFLLLIFGIFTAGNQFEALKYNIYLVSLEQFWYFGVPPNNFITSVFSVFSDKFFFFRLVFGFFIFLILVSFFKKLKVIKEFQRTELSFLLLLLVYSLIATSGYLGYTALAYSDPFIRAVLLIALLLLGRFFPIMRRNLLDRFPSALRLLKLNIILIIVILVAGHFLEIIDVTRNVKRENDRNVGRSFSGVYLSPGWTKTVNTYDKIFGKERIKQGDIWSTYSGLLEYQYGIFQPDTDYIIHALGPEQREAYLKKFRETRPKYVTTIKPRYFPYEEWLQQTSWDFYRDLVENYDVVALTSHSVIWKQREDALWSNTTGEVRQVRLKAGQREVEIPLGLSKEVKTTSIVVISLNYKINNSVARVPVVGNLPRYLIRIKSSLSRNPISLPPYRNTLSFPIFVDGSTNPVLEFETTPNILGANFEVKSLTVEKLSLPEKTINTISLGNQFIIEREEIEETKEP